MSTNPESVGDVVVKSSDVTPPKCDAFANLSASAESVLERECNHIAEEIVAAALEAATAQVISAQLAREIAADSKAPLRSSSSQDESPSTSKRVSFSSPKKAGKENAVASLTSKLRGMSFRTSPNKNKGTDNKKEAPEKECYIL